jgi:hypothetical protein
VALCVLYALMAALPAAVGSKLVLATVGGSPGWLLGPLRFAGISAASGRLAGPLFYAALWVALLLYVVVVRGSAGLNLRVALGVVAGLHVLFLLAPPLLSQDVFSYISYARMGEVHHLNPYTHAPIDIPGDPVFGYAGSIHAVSAYGPVFTVASYALAPLGVPAAFWVLKVVAALASFGVVVLVARLAQRLGRDPVFAALAVGLNPLVLVHVVGGAHNEALTMLIVLAGVALWFGGRQAGGVATSTAAIGVKASAAIVVPFLVVAERARALRLALVAVGTVVALALLGVVVFGTHALDAFSLISSNQDRSSRFSIPHKVAQLTGGLDVVRGVFAVLLVLVVLWLLWRTWRGLIEPIDGIGWATFATLIASAWLVPWYILWLLPFAALSRDRRLRIATLLLSAWMLAIAVPL